MSLNIKKVLILIGILPLLIWKTAGCVFANQKVIGNPSRLLALSLPLNALDFDKTEGVAESGQEKISCFDFYQFQKINISLSITNKTSTEAAVGESLTFQGTVENQTDVAITQGEIRYRLVKINPNSQARRTQGDQIFNQGLLIKKINLAPGEIKQIKASYQLPKVLSSGDYRFNFYFTQNGQFDWAGLFFTDDVVGSFLPVTILGKEREDLPIFDRAKTTVNDKPHRHIGFMSSAFEKGSQLTIKTVLTNPSQSAASGRLKSKLYYWDQKNADYLLDTKQENIILGSGEEKPLSYNIEDAKESVYLLEQLFSMPDPQSNSSYQTVIFTRVSTTGSRGRINSLGLSRYPLFKGDTTTFYVCFHNTSANIFDGRIMAEAIDEEGNLLADLSSEGNIPGDMQVITKEFALDLIPRAIILSAKIVDEKGEIVDKATITYDCQSFAPDTCPKKPSSGVISEEGLEPAIQAKKKKDAQKLYFLIAATLIMITLSVGLVIVKRRQSGLMMFFLLLLIALAPLLFPSNAYGVWSGSGIWSKNDSIEMRTDICHSGGCLTDWRFFKADYAVNLNYSVTASVEDGANVGCEGEITFTLSTDGSIAATGYAGGTPKVYFEKLPDIPSVCDPETASSCRYCDSSLQSCLYPGSRGTVAGSCCMGGGQLLSNAQFAHLRRWGLNPENIFDDREQVRQHSSYMSVTPYGSTGAFVDPKPVLQLTSDNPELITCGETSCTIIREGGTARISVKTSPTTAKILADQVCIRDDDYYEDKCSVSVKTKTHEVESIDLGFLTVTVDVCPSPTISPMPINTPTPVPTAMPTPTITPILTATPTPLATLTPTITPTPEPPANCACYLITSDSSNPTAVKKGETLNFTAEAYVDTPDTAKVKEMGFVLNQVDPDTFEVISEIANSGLVTCDGVPQPDGSVCDFNRTEEIDGKNTDVYRAKWSYQIKDTDPLGLYRLELTINCAWKQAYGGSRVLGMARDYYLKLKESQVSPTSTPVLPTPTPQKATGFQAFLRNILNFFGVGRQPVPLKPQGARTQGEPTPPITIIAPTGRTLKLGTFEPLPEPKDCTELYFRVVD